LIACIVPAAGVSSRFPWNKLLYGSEKPLITQTISNILDSALVSRIIVVTGYRSNEIVEAIRRYIDTDTDKIWITHNPNYNTGMSSSIKRGLEALRSEPGLLRGIMVNPADAAWIHPGIYDYVSIKFLESGKKIAVATYQGKRGHPIIFSTSIFNELEAISEETRGLKSVVNKYWYDTLLVETGYPGVLLDLDTVLDLNRVKEYSWKWV